MDNELSAIADILEYGEDAFPVRMNRALNRLAEVVGGSGAYLLAPDGRLEELVVLAAHRPDLVGKRKEMGAGSILGRAFQTRKRVFIRDVPRHLGPGGSRASNRSILIQPVISAEAEIKGLLWLGNRRSDLPFDRQTGDLGAKFAAIAAYFWHRLEAVAKPMFDSHPRANIMEDLFSESSPKVHDDLRGMAELVDEFTHKQARGEDEDREEEEYVRVYSSQGEKIIVPEQFSGPKIKRTYYLRPNTLQRLERVQKRLMDYLPPEKKSAVSKSYLVEVALSIVLRDYESDPWASMLTDYIETDIGFHSPE